MRVLILIVSVLLGLGLGGCGKKGSQTGDQASNQGTSESKGPGEMPSPDVTRGQGTEAAPMTNESEIPIEGLFLLPFFDEAGTQPEITVKPGEQFKLYIIAETVDPYPTGGVQLRLQLPPGLNVLYTVEFAQKLASLGSYDYSYMCSYACQQPGRFVVVSYMCQAAADFKGGQVEVLPGFLADNASFLGFTTCEFIEVRATGGTATIRVN